MHVRPTFAGTSFINTSALYQNKRYLDFLRMFYNNQYAWRATGAVDNVDIIDTGPGKTPQDEAIFRWIDGFCASTGVPVNTVFRYSPKSMPKTNQQADNGQPTIHIFNPQANPVLDDEKLTTQQIIASVSALHNKEFRKNYFEGCVDKDMYQEIQDNLDA